MYNRFFIIIHLIGICISQNIFTEYVVNNGDTLDVFSYQVPSSYSEDEAHPLLVAFHQWGGNQNSPYNTTFDEEAEMRNWFFLSPYGGASNNYNHQEAQDYTKQAILWLSENYSIDPTRIYMVGGSMGGAAGAIYANNHLNPKEPMVAATASASGILDCERRAIEMDGNNSMIEWFGGNWDEVPFEYHRNSAVYFADSTQSMHYNLQHLPLYLDFGITEPHRTHAEDLYDLIENYNNNMWIDTEPTGSHGYPVFDEYHVCDWLNQYSLDYLDEPQQPYSVNVNLDEPSRAYWIEATNQFANNQFIRINAHWFQSDGRTIENIIIHQINNSDSLILHILDETIEDFIVTVNDSINLGFSGSIFNGDNLINIEIQNSIDCEIDYMISDNIIWLETINSTCNNEGLDLFFEFSMLPDIYDDINQDGIWDVLDIILVVGYIMDTTFLNENQQLFADLNNDGIINVLDVVEIINLILNNRG